MEDRTSRTVGAGRSFRPGEATASNFGARLRWLDVAKGVAIAAVVIGHTVKPGMVSRDVIFSFHMPLFFFVAGYTFRPKAWGSVFSASVKRLLLPYVLLVLVTLIPVVVSSTAPLGARIAALGQAVAFPAGYPATAWMDYRMWFGVPLERVDAGFYGVGMAWFLWVLFLARLVLNAVTRIRRVGVQAVTAVFLFGVGVGFSGLFGLYAPGDFDLALMACGFMYAGYLVHALGLVGPGRLRLVALALAVWFAGLAFSHFEMSSRDFGLPVLAAVSAFAASYVVCMFSYSTERLRGVQLTAAQMASRLVDGVAWVGKNSLLVFCMHAIDGFFFSWSGFSVSLEARSFLGPESAALVMSLVRLAFDAALIALVRVAR